MRLPLSYLIFSVFLFLPACVSQSSKKEKPKLIVKHVFTSGLPDRLSGFRADFRHDYYYVYNYTDADYPLFEKMLDTLFIDTTYEYHKYLFFYHDDDLPDTMALKMEMANPSDYELKKDPGSAEYKKYAIVSFRYKSGFVSQADQVRPEKVIPDNYMITTSEGNNDTERYFLKDSINGNLMEVEKSVISIPDSGIR